tara:strand:- start:1158 stop:2288 length:1131 start_codon:yes stop_codon:yes gene_type:complete
MAYTSVNPKSHFDVKTYEGSSSTKTISGVGFKPDLVWTKDRTEGNDWGCYDSSRGVGKWLKFNETDSQNGVTDITATATSLASFTSDGFTIASMSSEPIGNKNGNYFVSYMFKANGASKTTNNAGANGASIASVYQANTTSGVSIIEYTGTGSAGTLAHGLGVAPKAIMIKRLNAAEGWQVYHGSKTVNSAPETDYYEINTNAGAADNANRWNDTAPTSAVFSIGTHAGLNTSGSTYVAYCFAQKNGFSSMGAYTGVANNADGPFLYTGFKPSMIIIKRSDGAESWQISTQAQADVVATGGEAGDQGRQGNLTQQKLAMNVATGENATQGSMDIYATGFKPRDTDGIHNYTNYEYIYIAFAAASIVGTNGQVANAY